jgi:hypothetical protein
LVVGFGGIGYLLGSLDAIYGARRLEGRRLLATGAWTMLTASSTLIAGSIGNALP